MNLDDLLRDKGIDPKEVLVFRHRPVEADLNKVIPWLAAEKPDIFNAYQQTQSNKTVEQEVARAKFVAAFIGHEPGKAVFVGLYANEGVRPLTHKQFWQIRANHALREFGSKVWAEKPTRRLIRWFDLVLTDFYAHWQGKLIICWPRLDRNWHRWANRPKNKMPIHAILEDSALDAAMPEWHTIDLNWQQLNMLPKRWKSKLAEWRGIYYIFDTSDGKGYVGSASGRTNLLGRWRNYAKRGHGGNRLLRKRDSTNFRFTILQRVSPDMEPSELNRLEASWKERLHTRQPFGLNDN